MLLLLVTTLLIAVNTPAMGWRASKPKRRCSRASLPAHLITLTMH